MNTRGIRAAALSLIVVAGMSGCVKDAPGNRAADEAAIHGVLEQISTTFNAGNFDGMLAQYLDDVVVLAPGAPDIVGKAAWRQGLDTTLPPGAALTLTFDTAEIAIQGDLAYERGTYALQATDKASGAQLLNLAGRHMHIFRRQADGQWRGWRLMENTAEPAATTASVLEPG